MSRLSFYRSLAALVLVSVLLPNAEAQPSLTPSGNSPTYVAGGAPVVIDDGLTLGLSEPTISGASVYFPTQFLPEDQLNFTDQNGITGSYDSFSGVLSLFGSATPAQYQDALRSVTFSSSAADPTDGGLLTSRTIWFSAEDSVGVTDPAVAVVVQVSASDGGGGDGGGGALGPVLIASSSTPDYTVGGSPVVIDDGISVGDPTSPTLFSASLSIDPFTFVAGDLLNFTDQNGITGTYDSDFGILTLLGTASLANYQTALRSITFSSIAADPTAGGFSTSRTIGFGADNGTVMSFPPVTKTVTIGGSGGGGGDGPTLTVGGGHPLYTADGFPAIVDLGITLASGSPSIAGATVSIDPVVPGDLVNFADQNGITGSYNSSSGILTLTGSTTPENYETALRSIAFSSSAGDPTNGGTSNSRTIGFTVDDGASSSPVVTKTVAVNSAGGGTHAEIFVANSAGNSVAVFGPTAVGNVAPSETLSGAATGISTPFSVAVNASSLFVASIDNSSIRIFSLPTAGGDIAPDRTITATGMNRPEGIAADATHVYVANPEPFAQRIFVFPVTADGNVTPERTLSGASTLLNFPQGVAVNSSNLFVANSQDNKVLVFQLTDDGDVAPSAAISGASTGLSVPMGLAVDANRIYVANGGADGSGFFSVTVYALSANGNVAPTATISGANTGLFMPYGIAVDANYIYVANSNPANIGQTSIGVYNLNASGNAAPVATITGASTGLSAPLGLAIAPAATALTPTVTVSVGAYTYDGSAQGPVAADVNTGGSTGAVTLSYVGTGTTSYGPSATPPTATGTYTVTASVAADSNYNGASSSATAFSIKPVITAVSPATGTANTVTTLTLTGQGFGTAGTTINEATYGFVNRPEIARTLVPYLAQNSTTVPRIYFNQNTSIVGLVTETNIDPGDVVDFTITVNGVPSERSTATFTASPPPNVTGVTSSTPNGSYKAGNEISIHVNFNEAVIVTDTPRLMLETGTTDRVIDYNSGSGSNSLTFLYTVQAGDNSADLDYAGTTALTLNGGTIRNTAGVNAVLTLPNPGATGSLGANKDLVIDTIAPATPSAPGAPTGTPPTISGTAEPGSFVALLGTGGTLINIVQANSSGIYTFPLPSGDNVLTVQASDLAGNVSSASSGLTIVVPKITGITPTSGPANNVTAITLTGQHFGTSVSNINSVTYGLVGDAGTRTTVPYLGQNTAVVPRITSFLAQNTSTTVGILTGTNIAPGQAVDFTITINGVPSERSAATFAASPPPPPSGGTASASASTLSSSSSLTLTAPGWSSPGGGTLSYQWSRTSGTGSPVILNSPAASSTLVIPANTLPGGTTYTFTVTVTDSFDQSSTGSVSVAVINPPAITSPSTATGVLGRSFLYQVTTAATNPTYSATGLPGGLSINAGTGVISGVPTATGTFNAFVTVNSVTGSSTVPVTFTINPPPPIINSAASATGRQGTAFNFGIAATNTPTSFGATGLPTGLTINQTSGVISGTPTVSGVFPVTLLATNAGGTTTSPFVITVNPPLNAPVYNGPAQVSGMQGLSLNFTPAFANSPTSFAAVSGALPNGVTFNPANAVISGTPTQAGVFTFTFSATNAGGTLRVTISLTVNPPPTAPKVTSPSTASGQVGVAFNYQITATVPAGFPSVSAYGATGLPAGLSLSQTTPGLITGTPTTQGTFTVQLTATNSTGTSPVAILIISISPSPSAPIITSSPVAQGRVGDPFILALTATNSPTAFAVTSGALPAGLSLSQSSPGLITGTPTQVGQFAVWLAASNSSGFGFALQVLFNIAPSVTTPVITSNGTAAAQAGQPFSYRITATNTPTSFGATSLPAGLTLDSATGVISGIPSNPTTTAIPLALTATNASGTSTPKTLLLTIAPAPATPVITSPLTKNGQVGAAFSYRIEASDNPTSFVAQGLPGGLALDSASGFITGTPTTSDTFEVTLRAGNAAGLGRSSPLAVSILPAATAPRITSQAAVSGKVGQDFIYTISVDGTATSFALTGTLPLGLTLNTLSGDIVGQPAAPGVSTVQLTATGPGGTSMPQSLVFNIAPADSAPRITSSNLTSATVGQDFSYTITAAGAPPFPAAPFPAPFTLDAVVLPPGLAVNPSTGVIAGQPTAAGRFTASLVGTNSAGTGPLRDLTFDIRPAAAAPKVTSSTHQAAQVGAPFSYHIVATNNPTAYEVLGAPDWMTVNSSTGALAGTPRLAGSITVKLLAKNAAGASDPLDLTIPVAASANAPVVTSPRTATGTAGTNFTYIIAATVPAGAPPVTSYFATGLPSGLSLNPNSGLITGRPAVSGQFEIALIVRSSAGASQPVTLIVTISTRNPSSSLGGSLRPSQNTTTTVLPPSSVLPSQNTTSTTPPPSSVFPQYATGSGSAGTGEVFDLTITVNGVPSSI